MARAVQAPDLGIAHGVTAAAVEAALKGAAAEGRRVGAVLMVRGRGWGTPRCEPHLWSLQQHLQRDASFLLTSVSATCQPAASSEVCVSGCRLIVTGIALVPNRGLQL